MLVLLTSILLFSSIAMAALLYAKHWELTTGRILLAGVRPHMERLSGRTLAALEYYLPLLVRRLVRLGVFWARTRARDLLARLILTAEHTLEGILEWLRHSVTPPRGLGAQASSAFLREVAEHKRKLTRIARVRRVPVADGVANPEIK